MFKPGIFMVNFMPTIIWLCLRKQWSAVKVLREQYNAKDYEEYSDDWKKIKSCVRSEYTL